MSYVTIFAESEFKVLDEIVLNTGGPFTCEYVTLFQSIHRGTLSIHWYITQNFSPIFSMFVRFRRSSKTAMISRFLKVSIARSSFMNKVYNGGFLPEFGVSMLKQIIALV